jgi:RNA polymerase sigma factor (sigma-70 family)
MVADREPLVVVQEAGFEAIFRAWFAKVARTAALIARDPAAGPDLAQEAFTRLYTHWDEMSSEDHARNFVYTVASNLARTHRHRSRRSMSMEFQADQRISIADHAQTSADWVSLVEALDGLSARQRTCVVLADYADLDAASVANVLGLSAATVRVHLMRARRALRAALSPAEEEDG